MYHVMPYDMISYITETEISEHNRCKQAPWLQPIIIIINNSNTINNATTKNIINNNTNSNNNGNH